MREWSKDSRTAICFCLFLDRASPLFYQKYNTRAIRNSKLIEHCTKTVLSASSSKFTREISIVVDVSNPMDPFQSTFSWFPFAVCVDYDLCLQERILLNDCGLSVVRRMASIFASVHFRLWRFTTESGPTFDTAFRLLKRGKMSPSL